MKAAGQLTGGKIQTTEINTQVIFYDNGNPWNVSLRSEIYTLNLSNPLYGCVTSRSFSLNNYHPHSTAALQRPADPQPGSGRVQSTTSSSHRHTVKEQIVYSRPYDLRHALRLCTNMFTFKNTELCFSDRFFKSLIQCLHSPNKIKLVTLKKFTMF